ncbi:MAG: PASTA domain-containing protein [Candidatus Marinimicrobia bacterium]|nr:PASTA domain-containing protein [Candidatus Neomarinimicrobiota bacterium]
MKKIIGRLIYFAFIFGVVSVLVGLFVNFIVMPMVVDKGQERMLLSVTGHSFEEAKSLLQREGFQAVRGETQSHPDLEPYTVLDQKPKAGQQVKMGRRVYLTLSTPEKSFPMPDVVGKTLRGASLILEDNNLMMDSVLYEYSTRPKDVVVRQYPDRGGRVPRNTLVNLWVSLGISPFYIVPDIIFSSMESAVDIIEKAGLEVGNIIYEVNQDFTPYTVISQSIDPGREVRQKKKINLVVSTLPETIE